MITGYTIEGATQRIVLSDMRHNEDHTEEVTTSGGTHFLIQNLGPGVVYVDTSAVATRTGFPVTCKDPAVLVAADVTHIHCPDANATVLVTPVSVEV
tara:strand:+ start:6260 stop:6550 length:291 start_codon:yes stop_codon:yes gene_type:complete